MHCHLTQPGKLEAENLKVICKLHRAITVPEIIVQVITVLVIIVQVIAAPEITVPVIIAPVIIVPVIIVPVIIAPVIAVLEIDVELNFERPCRFGI
jgi:hypothetical protein